jgi:hypothetical protein
MKDIHEDNNTVLGWIMIILFLIFVIQTVSLIHNW